MEYNSSHLEKVKKRNMFDERPVEALVVFEEEEISKGGVYDVRVSPRKLDQLQALLSAVPPPPEGGGVLLGPRRPRVGLNRHHVQAHPVRQAEDVLNVTSSAVCDITNLTGEGPTLNSSHHHTCIKYQLKQQQGERRKCRFILQSAY